MPTTATAAVLHEANGAFTLQEVELDDPRGDEILVRIEASGVCHTDMMARGMLAPPTATLRGIIQGSALPNIFLPKLIALQQQGRFPYERLIKIYDFADINQAFEDSEA